jgi:hypothetical protein
MKNFCKFFSQQKHAIYDVTESEGDRGRTESNLLKTHDLMSSFSKCVNSASNLAGFQRTVDKAVTQQELVG